MSLPDVAAVAGLLGLLARPAAPAAPPSGPPAETPADPAAHRFELPVDVTASMTAGWRSDRDYGEMLGRLNLSRQLAPWHASVRLDTSTFVDAPDPGIEDRYTVEKASAGWRGRSLDVIAGDAYVSFGRGLALSLRKLDELGIDTTLRGAKLLVHHGPAAGTVAFGYANINNVDEATSTSVDDPYDLIGGAQGQVLVADRVNLGAYGAAVLFHDPLGLVPTDRYTDRSFQYGVTVDAPRATQRFGFYLEAMGQEVTSEPTAQHPRGFALYGSATGYLGKATLLFEGKAYGDLTPLSPNLGAPAFDAVSYSSPPTVERVQQTIENPATEIAGGRVRLDWSFSPALLAYVNYGAFRDWHGYSDPDSGDIEAGTIHDPYAGLEARWDQARSWAIASAGWRVVLLDTEGGAVRRDGHVEVDVSQALDARWSITARALHEERLVHESALLEEDFRQGTLSAGFRLRPSLTVAGGYDYTTEPTQPRRDYLNASIGWDFTPSSGLRLLVGSARGGLKCISGVCRVLPPFEGVKLSATLRF
ncbi:MAG TPA: DUF6029 family protein [Kofleriaceae bacterium]|nr:DUF6029 family protein [Kofleriaceae bacterium]